MYNALDILPNPKPRTRNVKNKYIIRLIYLLEVF